MQTERGLGRRGPWTVTGSHAVYENRWMRIREDHVIHPDGNEGMFGVVEGRPSASIVAVTADEEVYLVGQHRYAIDTYSWDIPGGALEAEEVPLSGAQRELQEETGLRAARWTPLGHYYPHRDIFEITVYLYMAQDLTIGAAAPEGSEQLDVRRLPLEEALRAAQQGEISGGPSVVGLVRAWHHLRDGALLPP